MHSFGEVRSRRPLTVFANQSPVAPSTGGAPTSFAFATRHALAHWPWSLIAGRAKQIRRKRMKSVRPKRLRKFVSCHRTWVHADRTKTSL